MITKNKLNLNLIISLCCCAVFCIYSFIYNGWFFLAYSLFYAILPGYAIADTILCKTDFHNSLLKLAAGTFMGIFMLFACYFLLYPRPALQLLALKASGPAVCLLYLVFCLVKKRTNIAKDAKTVFSDPLFSLLCIFMLAMMTINLVLNFPSKASLDYQDYVWHISLVNSLASGHPFRYFNVQAGSLSYHYFSDLFLAIGKMLFGFDGFRLIIQLQPMFLSFINAVAVTGFFASVFNNDKAKTAFASVSLLACYGMGLNFLGFNLYNHFYSQFFSNINAVTFSIPLLCTALWAVYKAVTANKTDIIFAGIVAAMMFLLTGAKGPFGVVLTAAFAAAIAARTICDKKLSLAPIVYFAGGAAGFAAAFTTFMGNASDGLEISAEKAFNIIRLSNFGQIISSLSAKGIPVLASKIALTPLHFISVTTVFGLLFIAGFIHFIRHRNKGSSNIAAYILFLTTVVVACGGYYILFHKSTSQMYFLYAAFPALTVLVTDQFFRIISVKPNKKLISIVLLAIMALPMAYYQFSVTEDYNSADKKVEITQDYIDTFSWIEQNTPSDCIIATNRHNLPDGTQRWFYDAAYCNRQFYLSGYGYGENADLGPLQLDPAIQVNSLFFTDYDHKHNLVCNLNISYLLIYKDEAENVIPYEDGFETVFETGTTCVVKVIR